VPRLVHEPRVALRERLAEVAQVGLEQHAKNESKRREVHLIEEQDRRQREALRQYAEAEKKKEALGQRHDAGAIPAGAPLVGKFSESHSEGTITILIARSGKYTYVKDGDHESSDGITLGYEDREHGTWSRVDGKDGDAPADASTVFKLTPVSTRRIGGYAFSELKGAEEDEPLRSFVSGSRCTLNSFGGTA
jgi:hypothetical protein